MIFIYNIDTYHSSYFFYVIVVIVITQAKIKMNRTHNIDVKDILKDVEVCLKQGLERKVSSFFDDYAMFQQTHNEVLNLSIVKKMLHVNGSECKHEYNDHNEHYKRSETMYHESIVSRYETELETLKNENKNLSIELERYKKYLDFYNDNDDEESDEEPFQPLNLEITEKYSDMDDKNKNTDNNRSLQIQIENNIKNIVLNDADKDMVEEEEKEEEEEEEEEEEDEKDDTEEEEEDEEEEVVVKKECVSAAVEIHSCSSDSEEEENLIKSLDNSEEEEEVMPTFPTAQELTKLKEINHVVSNDTTEDVEVKVDVEAEADANSVESENDVQEDTEEDTEEEEEEAEADEEEEELFEVDINGVMYVSNDDEDGTIYSYVNEEVGDEIGQFIGKVAHVYKGANKGVYDRTKCKFNL